MGLCSGLSAGLTCRYGMAHSKIVQCWAEAKKPWARSGLGRASPARPVGQVYCWRWPRILPAGKALVACAEPGNVVPDERQVLHRIREIRGTALCFLILSASSLPSTYQIVARCIRFVAQAKGKSSAAASSSRATKITKAEKKVCSLAGQKFDPPEETDILQLTVQAEFWYCDFLLFCC
jgi:hypothetical protein